MKYTEKEYETRYFAGIEYEGGIDLNNRIDDIHNVWNSFFNNDLEKIKGKKEPQKFIGLECYPPDFHETRLFDYYALVQLDELYEVEEGLVTKKLPAGKYISFEIKFDEMKEEIHKVYKYITDNDIQVHKGFDFEDYLLNQNYGEKGAILNFSLMLEDK